MKFAALNDWLTLMANLGVLAGIVFLGIEVDQNSELMRIQISQARSDAISANLNAFATSEFVPAIQGKLVRGEALNEEELYRLQLVLRSANAQQQNTFYQVNRGMLEDSALAGVRDFALQLALSEYSLNIWLCIQAAYSEEYRNYINAILAESR